MPINPKFGQFVKKKRLESRLTLRGFCRKYGFDPGNISKIERGLFSPPQDDDKRRVYAEALGIKKGTDDWLTFFDLAAICSGTIPTDVISDDRLLLSLPIIFRTLRETETDKDGLRKLIEAIRRDLS